MPKLICEICGKDGPEVSEEEFRTVQNMAQAAATQHLTYLELTTCPDCTATASDDAICKALDKKVLESHKRSLH